MPAGEATLRSGVMRTELAVQGLPVTGRRAITRSGRLRPMVGLRLAGLVAAVGCISALLTLSGGNPGRAPTTTTTRPDLTSLPMAAQGPVSAALGRDSAAYRVRGLQAVNPVQRFRAGFSRRGVKVVSGPARLGITLSAYGNGSALQPVRSALPSANANRVRYAHGDLTEWYANGPLGIEQGFDVAARPSAAAGPLTLSLA